MRIVADPEVRSFLIARGGVVTVSTRSARCCTGALTTLSLETAPPTDPARYERFEDHGVVVYYASARGAHPDELVLKLKGSRRPHVEALWDGCLYAI
ncbi:MAG: hypothetical protein WB770_07300 [Acidimicrobiales bacterium]